MLVRSPLLTSHKWRELVPSWRWACRCHGVFLWRYLFLFCFVFVFLAFIEAAALCSFVVRYASLPIVARVSFFFPFCLFGVSLFPIFFGGGGHCRLLLYTSYVFSFRMVFFYLVTTGWIFDISLVEISIINHDTRCDIVHLIWACPLVCCRPMVRTTAACCTAVAMHTALQLFRSTFTHEGVHYENVQQ